MFYQRVNIKFYFFSFSIATDLVTYVFYNQRRIQKTFLTTRSFGTSHVSHLAHEKPKISAYSLEAQLFARQSEARSQDRRSCKNVEPTARHPAPPRHAAANCDYAREYLCATRNVIRGKTTVSLEDSQIMQVSTTVKNSMSIF